MHFRSTSKYSKNYTKNNTLSPNLEKLKNITEINPDLILTVDIQSREVLLEDENLKFDTVEFEQALSIMRSEIESRPKHFQRVEAWECQDMFGNYSERAFRRLLNKRKEPTPRVESRINERALRELSRAANVPVGMERLYLNELRLDTHPSNDRFRDYAKTLGLF